MKIVYFSLVAIFFCEGAQAETSKDLFVKGCYDAYLKSNAEIGGYATKNMLAENKAACVKGSWREVDKNTLNPEVFGCTYAVISVMKVAEDTKVDALNFLCFSK